MAVIGIDDTDSREEGMCTTYAATRVAERLDEDGVEVRGRLLVRLNPAVKRKTRGNAALSIHAETSAEHAFDVATDTVSDLTAVDERTSPGVVVADCSPGAVPEPVVQHYLSGLREIHDLEDAVALADEYDWKHAAIHPPGATATHRGYGRIGALAAIGAWRGGTDWTYEHLAYREFDRCGTTRAVDEESVFSAAADGYPVVWDTVDREEGQAVCVPHAPGPILYGIRGDDPEACRAVAGRIESEPVDRAATFRTNQGTDAHIAPGEVGALRDGAGYAVDGVVASAPETRQGGHTFFALAHPEDVSVTKTGAVTDGSTRTVDCVAFEPTKRFRKRVRDLRVGDAITAFGEHERGTVKLEKFAARDLVEFEPVTPDCPECGRTMESAGRNSGYRCRDCGTSAPGKVPQDVDRSIERGWYEVPPCARRHVAKPLVRGGFDAPTHPER